MTTSHRSTAYVKPIAERGRPWKPDPITSQFRFIVRMAVACHERQVPYDLAWSVEDRRMRATITVTGKIPTPKALPKPPKQKPVSDWKPAIWDAEYRLEAYHDGSPAAPRASGRRLTGYALAGLARLAADILHTGGPGGHERRGAAGGDGTCRSADDCKVYEDSGRAVARCS
jgi:hypothetical protein